MTTLWRSLLNATSLILIVVLVFAFPDLAKSLFGLIVLAAIVGVVAKTSWRSATGEPPDSAAE